MSTSTAMASFTTPGRYRLRPRRGGIVVTPTRSSASQSRPSLRMQCSPLSGSQRLRSQAHDDGDDGDDDDDNDSKREEDVLRQEVEEEEVDESKSDRQDSPAPSLSSASPPPLSNDGEHESDEPDEPDGSDESTEDDASDDSDDDPHNDDAAPADNICGRCGYVVLAAVLLSLLLIFLTHQRISAPPPPICHRRPRDQPITPCPLLPDLNRLLNSPRGLSAYVDHIVSARDHAAGSEQREAQMVSSRDMQRRQIHNILSGAVQRINSTASAYAWTSASLRRGRTAITCEMARSAASIRDVLSIGREAVFEASLLADVRSELQMLERERDTIQEQVRDAETTYQSYRQSRAADRDQLIQAIAFRLNSDLRPRVLQTILGIVKIRCWWEAQAVPVAAREAFVATLARAEHDQLRALPDSTAVAGNALATLHTWAQALLGTDIDSYQHNFDSFAGEDFLNPKASTIKAERSCASVWVQEELGYCVEHYHHHHVSHTTGRDFSSDLLPDSRNCSSLSRSTDTFWFEWFNMIPITLSSGQENASRAWDRYLIAPGSSLGRAAKEGAAEFNAGRHGDLSFKDGYGVLVHVTKDTPWWPGLLKWWISPN